MNTLSISLTIDAPIEKTWASIADWPSQGNWMLQTKVWVESEIVEGVGTQIAAFTGPLYKKYPRFKKLGILDTMTVTKWQPPADGRDAICDVLHTGAIIKGTGTFRLHKVSPTRTSFDWSESVEAPRVIFLLLAPFLYAGVRISLARLARSLRNSSD